ncbi:helix-turn-helix transcriptional regulator [Vibrio alginolyticus]|uniref:helix-turn-helix transcriptional regulator n=1 Tax=Vibrio alginolyticus TaxID=663 RepID=UPI00215C9633|nr:WYL domain-containing protein [Vibrio alginolyticus]MCR9543782.1 WYL domain-containing protein [Vibrio alginolyticus]MCR9559834.1 WYL domain-containing protein [Vibrio alginolyticus]
MPNRTNLVELTMTQPTQTQYHLELILAIYNLIPYNKKVTARQIQAQLSPLGLERSLRTIQRNLSAICAMFPNVMVDDRDKPFGYQKTETLKMSTTAHEAVLLFWLIESTKHHLPSSLAPLLDDLLSNIAPEDINNIQNHWSSKVPITAPTPLTKHSQVDIQIFQIVCLATLQQRLISLKINKGDGTLRLTNVQPISLVLHHGSPYLVWRTHTHTKLNTLLLSNIQEATMSSFRFELQTDAPLLSAEVKELFDIADSHLELNKIVPSKTYYGEIE